MNLLDWLADALNVWSFFTRGSWLRWFVISCAAIAVGILAFAA